MGAALPFIGAASLGMSALGSIAQGQQQSASAKYNAQIAENNAKIAAQNATFAGEEGAVNTEIAQQKTRSNVADIKVAQAANGVNVNTGSAVDVRASAAELGELNAMNIRSNAARQAYGYQTQAASDKAQAALDRQEASYDKSAGLIKGATTLIGGAASGYQSGLWGDWLGSNALNATGGNAGTYALTL